MARPVPPTADPTNRLPWIVLGLALLLILGGSALFFVNSSRSDNVVVTLGAEATATARALQAGAGRAAGGTPAAGVAGALTPPVLATPTPRATSTPIPVAIPSPTPMPAVAPATRVATAPAAPTRLPTTPPAPTAQPTRAPAPAAAPPARSAAPTAAAPKPAAPVAPPPAAAAPTQPAAAPAPTAAKPAQPAATPPPAAPTAAPPPPPPTPFAAQVSAAGGAGNTRQDFDRAYGNPLGETPTSRLVVYRKDRTEYRVAFAGEPQRAAFLVQVLPENSNLPFEETTRLSRQLMPRDSQPRAERPEGNDRYVVERFTSPTLARALPPEAFGGANPGDFLVLHLKNPSGAIEMIVVAAGDDIEAAIQRARQ